MRKAFGTMAWFGVEPVIAPDDKAAVRPLADALIAGGLPVAGLAARADTAAGPRAKIAAHARALVDPVAALRAAR